MEHDVNFNEMTSPTATMTTDDLAMCVDNLREIIHDGKAQWNKVAAILQVDGDDVDAVFAKARVVMAGIGGAASHADIQIAREAFPAFADLHQHLDVAIAHEMERFSRHCDELADMSMEKFIEFKNDSLNGFLGNARMWRQGRKETRTVWQRICAVFAEWRS